MALVLIATPGASNANSFGTRAEADAYFEGRGFVGAWTALVAANKDIYLVWATRLLDRELQWAGSVTSTTQSLSWPRQDVLARNNQTFLDSTTVPQEIKEASFELALALCQRDLTVDSSVESQGIKAFSAGPVSFTFRDSVKIKPLTDAALLMIPRWWIIGGPNSNTIDLARA